MSGIRMQLEIENVKPMKNCCFKGCSLGALYSFKVTMHEDGEVETKNLLVCRVHAVVAAIGTVNIVVDEPLTAE